jgi:hypothetical protein
MNLPKRHAGLSGIGGVSTLPVRPGGASPHAAQPGLLASRRFVIQRASWEDLTPPTAPSFSRPSPYPDDDTCCKHGLEYHAVAGNEGPAEKWGNAYTEHSGKSVGQSYGAQESEDYHSSSIDIPLGGRLSAPASLWNTMYACLKARCTAKPTLRPGHSVYNSKTATQADGVPPMQIGAEAQSCVRQRLKQIQPSWF